MKVDLLYDNSLICIKIIDNVWANYLEPHEIREDFYNKDVMDNNG